MNENISAEKLALLHLANKSIRTILKRNNKKKSPHFDSSKSINISYQNKSEIIKPNTVTILNKIIEKENIKIDKIRPPKIANKYSNVKLFTNRISKGMNFYNRMQLKKTKNKTIDLQRNIFNLHLNILNSKKNLLLKEKKLKERKIKFKSIFKELNPKFMNPAFIPLKENKMFRSNLSIFFPKVKLKKILFPESGSKSFDETYINKKKERENEKKIINDNLENLLDKIKKRILPKKKLIFGKSKLPEINNINLNKIKSCIHIEKNFKGKVEFIKTHLDGIRKLDNSIKNRYKSSKKYEINEGYIDLGVLGEGDNVSFKTDLIEENGLVYYGFSKSGEMDTIEERIHRIKKDNKEFKSLLQKYNKMKLLKTIQEKDFRNIKKDYKQDSFISKKNIYKDLYHMIFENKIRNLEVKKD